MEFLPAGLKSFKWVAEITTEWIGLQFRARVLSLVSASHTLPYSEAEPDAGSYSESTNVPYRIFKPILLWSSLKFPKPVSSSSF